ncbi:MAG: PAS domain-containing protein, partial [Thermodesulfobacteriota bacterium]
MILINNMHQSHNKIILIGIVLSVIFWIIEAALHVYIFHEGTFLQQLLSPEAHEAWMRLIVVCMFITFSIYAESIINIRRRAEEATRQAYTKLNQVLDTAADGMRLVDNDFTILQANDTFATLSGIGKDEAIGRKCYEVFRGPLCHSPACPLTRILQGEGRVECDVEKERCDGTTVPCILTATPLLTSDGKLLGIVEDFKDITDRKQAEAAQWESERQKQTILDASVDVIVQIDTEMRIVWANRTAGAILNEKPENLMGHTCHKVYQNSDTPCPDCPCKRALESGQ